MGFDYIKSHWNEIPNVCIVTKVFEVNAKTETKNSETILKIRRCGP